MKYFLLSLFFLGSSLFAYPRCVPELTQTLQAVYQLPEGKSLIHRVEAEGNFTIEAEKTGAFSSNAAWFPDERVISINLSKKRTKGSLICSLIFELHNAINQKQFNYFDRLAMQQQISKNKYIEAIERLEYVSAKNMVRMIQQGVEAKLFPSDTYWPIAPNFEEHFKVQIQAGHSRAIGSMYDSLVRSSTHMR